MQVCIVGIGMGNPALLTKQAQAAIDAAELLVGAQRMLDSFPDTPAAKLAAATPEKIAQLLRKQADTYQTATVLVSGDPGFYSAAKKLPALLPEMEVRVLCGVSSLQYFCARLGLAWDDVAVVSLHGRSQAFLDTVRRSESTFVLTGGSTDAQALCALLTENHLGACLVSVGSRLSYDDEAVCTDTAQALSAQAFPPLSVMLVRNLAPVSSATHGMEDAAFLRGKTPMTKAEVRAVSLAKLRLRVGDCLWDVGAGTGSVAVEAARVLRSGSVCAVEKDADALALLAQNKARFGLENLLIIAGAAPEALTALSKPDAVFIGGSSGNLDAIIDAALAQNSDVRIVVNAIALETVGAALTAFSSRGLPDADCVQIAVSKANPVGRYHMMNGQNPVFILSAGGHHD